MKLVKPWEADFDRAYIHHENEEEYFTRIPLKK